MGFIGSAEDTTGVRMNSNQSTLASHAAIKPKASIILPVRNNVRFIRQAIESALNQSYDKAEIIVVDGASTDGTQAIVRSFPSVRLISEPDRCQTEAINKGIDRTDGDIILILCGDDVLHRDGLKIAVEAFMSSHDAGIVFGKVGKIDECGNEISPGESFGEFDIKRVLLRNPRFPYSSYPSTTAFIRRSLLIRTGFRFDENIRTCPDFDMWLRLGPSTKVVYVPQVLAYWREHAESNSVRSNFRQVIVESKRKALDKVFADTTLPLELRRLEAVAYTILQIVDSSCYLIQNASFIKGLSEALKEIRKTPGVLLFPHIYGLLVRSFAIGILKYLKMHSVSRRTRLLLMRKL